MGKKGRVLVYLCQHGVEPYNGLIRTKQIKRLEKSTENLDLDLGAQRWISLLKSGLTWPKVSERLTWSRLDGFLEGGARDRER